MQRLEVSGAERLIYASLGFKELNSNTRDGVQALRKASGLCPARTLCCGSAQLGRVVGRQRRLDRVPATPDSKEDFVYVYFSFRYRSFSNKMAGLIHGRRRTNSIKCDVDLIVIFRCDITIEK